MATCESFALKVFKSTLVQVSEFKLYKQARANPGEISFWMGAKFLSENEVMDIFQYLTALVIDEEDGWLQILDL